MAYYTANKKIYSLFSNSSRYTVVSPKYYMGPVPGEFKNNNVYKSGGRATECTICTRPIIYLVCPQKFCISTVFNFSWDVITKCKIWRWEVYYERCALGMGPDEIVNYFFFLFTTLKLKSFIILWIVWPKRTHLLQCKCVLTDPKRLLISKNQYNDMTCIR